MQVTATGDASFSVGQIVERRTFDKDRAKVEREGGKLPEAEPHAFYLSAWEEDQHIIAQANAKIRRGRKPRRRPHELPPGG